MDTRKRTLIQAALVVDAETVRAAPGVLLVEGGRLVAAGEPARIGAVPDAIEIDLGDAVVMPALVNAHAHLDLSHLGPLPFRGDFVGWADAIRRSRGGTDDEIAASVERGIDLSRRGGTALIGDIAGAGSRVPRRVLAGSALGGVSYLEVFGLGDRQEQALETLRRAVRELPVCEGGVRLGLQPHAPYSCGRQVYAEAARLDRPLSTHLAETPEELLYAASATGPIAGFLERLGVADPAFTGSGLHPVEMLADALAARPWLCAHLNYVEPAQIELLASHRATVAYCPRASAYFGHPRAGHVPHAYRAMLEAGIEVALGTDGLPCLDTPDRISVLDEMRLLFRRDGVDPRRLLAMATVAGARALESDPALVSFRSSDRPRPFAGALALTVHGTACADGARGGDGDPLAQALTSDAAPRWIVEPTAS